MSPPTSSNNAISHDGERPHLGHYGRIQQLPTTAGPNGRNVSPRNLSNGFQHLAICKLPRVRLCNLANPRGDRGDDVYVCGCLVNAGKGLGGSRALQLWVWGMLIEIFCTIAELLLLQFKISNDII